jgi:hypothetical protein
MGGPLVGAGLQARMAWNRQMLASSRVLSVISVAHAVSGHLLTHAERCPLTAKELDYEHAAWVCTVHQTVRVVKVPRAARQA